MTTDSEVVARPHAEMGAELREKVALAAADAIGHIPDEDIDDETGDLAAGHRVVVEGMAPQLDTNDRERPDPAAPGSADLRRMIARAVYDPGKVVPRGLMAHWSFRAVMSVVEPLVKGQR
jgi:hypothetical protein